VEFVQCQFLNNLQAGSFEQASTVILDGSTIQLTDGGTGFVLADSSLDVYNSTFAVVAGSDPGTFFVAERSSNITLDLHSPTQETNVTGDTSIAQAQLNSSITCTSAFSSAGSAQLETNSVLSRSVTISPFGGGITVDASSTISTAL
jgi:hypothetical protein